MKRRLDLFIIIWTVLTASRSLVAQTTKETERSKGAAMSPQSATLGYVILYVKDVSASLAFYEKAFGLSRRFFHDDSGKAYGELETGAARVSFASLVMAKEQLQQDIVAASLNQAPLGFEIALVTPDVPALFAQAMKAGATAMRQPETKPWGQTVAYVRDIDGHLVELCTPMP